MGKLNERDPGRTAATLFATTFVFLGGLVFCSFILVAFVENPAPHLIVCAALFLGLALLSWLLGERISDWIPTPAGLLSRLTRRKPPTLNYEPRRRVRYIQFGSNQPPSVEDVREAAEYSPNNWVPDSPPRSH